MSTDQKFPDVDDMKKKLAERLEVRNKENVEKKKVFMYNLKQASDEYYNNLLNNVYNATDYMENSNNTNGCVYVSVPTQRLKWGEEEEKFIPWHWLHYGFPDRKKKGWWFRDTKFWDKEEDMIFRKLQKLCRQHNYYLYDISDPQKGNKTLLKLSVQRVEEYESEDLWHKFNQQVE
tara:strand:- start:1593 stop:2120 length:528 start_codon:yes stop_codon:yes gene_type:complete